MTGKTTRAERLATPLARDAIRKIAEAVGGCLRPLQLRCTNIDTGQVEQVMIPCGATLASICPSCANRAKTLRAEQCRAGWHLEAEPDPGPPPPNEDQARWLTLRAQAQADRDHAADTDRDTTELDALIGELDEQITASGVRGRVTTSTPDGKPKTRRSRSTRRRQDAPDLPRKKISPQTVGKVFTARDGKTYRPSMFLTLTCDSYGSVLDDGTPADPDSYDYTRAARDAIHFTDLIDRFIQNLRRYLGYDLQYYGTVEPQRRLVPHVHFALRGAISRNDLRKVIAATYHQVWWPSIDVVVYGDDQLPVWDESSGNYLNPATGEVLTTWNEALDTIGPHDEPLHVARFGPKFHATGVLAGSKDADKCIKYLTKYLTKQVSDCHLPATDAERAHVTRLMDALKYEPCSPTCANWLRYGIQPHSARPGLRPGNCKGKAHRAEYLGYAGRRVLVSRRWSGKTLADHRADRKTWLLEAAGIEAPDPDRYTWQLVYPGEPDYLPQSRRLLRVAAERTRWRFALDQARRKASDPDGNPPVTDGEAA